MSPKQSIFTSTDLILLIGIIVFTVAGVAYAGISGVVAIPGLTPAQRDSQPTVLQSPGQGSRTAGRGSVSASTQPSNTPSIPANGTVVVAPSPAAAAPSPAFSPSPVISPSPSPVASSPTPSPSSAATPDAQAQATADDMVRKDKHLPELKVALREYRQKSKNKKYPISLSYEAARTDSSSSSLQVLVKEGIIKELPTDPKLKDQGWWYGYYSADGTECDLTARLANTKDPAGEFDVNGAYLYHLPCGD